MSPDIKRFLLFLVKGIVIILVLDFTIGSGLDYLHGKMKGGERARAFYAINRSIANGYIFGSSRALYHYNPIVLKDSLNFSFYNAGRPAQTILYHLPVFKMILKRHKPKLVILDLNENELIKEDRKYDLINSLLPYYRQDESVKNSVDLIKPGYRYFAWSHILPYNSSAFAIIWRSIMPEKKPSDVYGYLSFKGNRSKDNKIVDNCDEKNEFDPQMISALEDFVQVCRINDIKLLVVTSPRFTIPKCKRKDIERIEQELKRLGVNYLNMSANKKYIDREDYMYDGAHLNYEGSVEFSSEIASYLKREYKFK